MFSPDGIAIDTNGNIYVTDSNNSSTSTPVYEYVLTSGTYAARTQLFTTPYGGGAPMTLDGAGNLYLDWNSGDGSGALYKQNRNAQQYDESGNRDSTKQAQAARFSPRGRSEAFLHHPIEDRAVR